jgi:LytS/YehU family sensor histidine kinase
VAPALHDLRVPPLTLQTLVENAIKHGISPLARGGRLELRATLGGGDLVLEVRDSGRGTASVCTTVPQGQGVGLTNLVRRLERLYGADAELRFRSAPDAGTTVTVRLPARRAARSTDWRAAS